MSRSRVQYIKIGKGISKEEKICVASFSICMILIILILWATTAWEAARVFFAGFLISAIVICAVVVLITENREYKFRKKCMEIRKERNFYDIKLSGELIEIPIDGTDLVEIKNIISRAKNTEVKNDKRN